MSSITEIFWYLRPNGGWAVSGQDFETAQFLDCEPITKAEYEQAVKDFPKWQVEQEKQKNEKRLATLAKLETLGLTVDDLKVLGLG